MSGRIEAADSLPNFEARRVQLQVAEHLNQHWSI
jgi:hypothetical protein